MAEIEKFSFINDELQINWRDGQQSQLAAIWLRDHCQMPTSRNQSNGQRLLNITDIPLDIRIQKVSQTENSLIIDFAPDSHRSEFCLNWLRQNCYCLNAQDDDRSEVSKKLWRGDSFDSGLPRFDNAAFIDATSSKAAALQSVKENGFVILNNVPCEDRQVLKTIAQFGFVRDTNYGPLFEVRTEINPVNLAYTNIGLGCHLDNPYRDPVPGIQLLHCLQSSAEGGESILQDGFMAANILREEDPQHFEILSQQWVNYQFQDSEANLLSRVPMIEVNDLNEIIKVRFNNRSIATLKLHPSKVRVFYAAYRHYAEIIEREDLQISFKLCPGDMMIFDNTRIMHARKAFAASGGARHLQGAYSDLDGLYSTLNRLTNEGQPTA